MPRNLLDRLNEWKGRFGPEGSGRVERLLAAIGGRRFRDPEELIRLHEALLFLRAYPRSPEVARRADALLFRFTGRIAALQAAGVDLDPFEEPEISGIAGTSLSAVFSYEVARRLAARHPRNVEIAWDRCDEMDRLGPVLARVLPLFGEDWPVEAHAPFREWISAARPRGTSDLAWLLGRVASLPLAPRERADFYEALRLPLTWRFGSRISRTRLRLPVGRTSRSAFLPARKLYCHSEPLLRRADVSLARELSGPPLPVRRLARREARRILDLILDASAMRFRELYGFSHPDEARVFHAEAGRGVEIYFFGVPPEWRLPLRAYHGGMFFKNGVPAGYVELLSLFERAEVGFNLYYTFREGESAWIYARLLRLFHQVLGVDAFSVDPYQIGLENPEAVDSGAFWFYRKLGFRPVDADAAALTAREERRMSETPGYRSSTRTLEKLARSYILYEGPSAQPGAWDRFRVRNLGLAAARAMAERRHGDFEESALALVLNLIPDLGSWTREEKRAVAEIVKAKHGPDEARYLRLMQRHARLRSAFLALLGYPKGIKHRVVILGGGFGGLYAARALRRAPVDITLIDRRNFHLFQPLLYQVATGSLSPAEICAPLRGVLCRQKNVRVLLGEAAGIDPAVRRVFLRDGAAFDYDSAIVATGSKTSYFGHDEWRRWGPSLKSVEEATAIRHKILYAFEAAERVDDAEQRRAWLTFAIVGAGATGVELAGALGEIAHHTLRRDFRSIRPEEARIIVLDSSARVLPAFPEELSARAEDALLRLGVRVRSSVHVVAVDEDGVSFRNPEGAVERYEAKTVLWAGGVTVTGFGHTLAAATRAETDRQGRLKVNPDLSIPGFPDLYVVGDLAWVAGPDGKPLPGVAQVAMQGGAYVARAIRARLAPAKDPRPFRYLDKGELAVIGRGAAVARIFGMRLSGLVAWLVWLFIHLMYLVQFRNRVVVFVQWGFHYLTFSRGARLITGELDTDTIDSGDGAGKGAPEP